MNNSRRSFIKNSSATLAGLGLMEFFPSDIYAKMRNKVGANDKINIGLIGLKNQGFNNIRAFLKIKDVNVLAICDIDDEQINKRKDDLAKLGANNLLVYKDYRKLLENKDIDAVLIATPDHWHCLQLTDALSAGKHVYCEKPIANSILEARAMVYATQKSGKVVQVNQWQRSEKHFQDAVAYVQSGKLGKIVNTKCWMYRGTDPLTPVPDSPVPAGVDYAMWLGPAQTRPFNIRRFHYDFRWFWDYAGGLMTDWGVHLLDYALLGMEASLPKSIVGLGGKYAYPNLAEETPDTLTTLYEFDNFNLVWDSAMGIDNGSYGRDHGIAFIGNNATLILNRGGWEVIEERQSENKVAKPLVKPSDNGLDKHAQNFIDAIRSNTPQSVNCSVQQGAHVATVAQMGNISYRSGQKVVWDQNASQFTDSAINREYLTSKYQNGYLLPMF